MNGPGHCAECHSERNFAGALIEERRFAGGPDPEGRGTVPNITPSPTGRQRMFEPLADSIG